MLLWIWLFHIPEYSQFHGWAWACMITFCAWYLLGALWGLLRVSTHTKSPIIISCTLPVNSTSSLFFQNLISSLSPPGGLPTLAHPPQPAGSHTVFPHSSVSFCTSVYSDIYIVSITRVLVVPCLPQWATSYSRAEASRTWASSWELAQCTWGSRLVSWYSHAEPRVLSCHSDYTKPDWEQGPSL